MQASVTAFDQPRGALGLAWNGVRRVVSRAALIMCVMGLLLFGSTRPVEVEVARLTASVSFGLLDWELARTAERLPRIALGLIGQSQRPWAGDEQRVRAYFAAPPNERAALRLGAEAAIERGLAALLVEEGITYDVPLAGPGALVFPPVSMSFVSPPLVLVVSPRDRIAVTHSELLRPDLSLPEIETLESKVDRLDVSSLVVPIGGLATYPTMVLEGTAPVDALAGVAHEWIHGYFFFHPLGQAYWSSPSARSINETAADIAARELGSRLAGRLGIAEQAPRTAGSRNDESRAQSRAFQAALQETRIEVDRLLAAGRVAEAEAYMARRRDELAEAGHDIRKLNQAYFAFYGSYGDARAGASAIPGQLRRLREESGSVGEFIRRVARLRDAADLARAVGTW